jgi:precorrin-2 dehydrogenase/sirohydrochlorin ferrochelatase
MCEKETGVRHLFPLLLDLEGMNVIVIGGGAVAERKVRSLLEGGASVTIVAPELTQGLSELVSDRSVVHIARAFSPGDLAGASLVFAAADDERVSTAVAEEARRLSLPVNAVDRPELCTFIVPAVMRQGPLTIAVSTSGASPAWSRRIKQHLIGEFGEEYKRLLEALYSVRRRCMREITEPAKRREILQKLADDSLLELARTKNARDLEAIILERIFG